MIVGVIKMEQIIDLGITLFVWVVMAYPFILGLLIILCLIGLGMALCDIDRGDKGTLAISSLWICCFPSTLIAMWFYPENWLELLIGGVIVGTMISFWFKSQVKKEAAKRKYEEEVFYREHPESKIWGHFNLASMPDALYFSGLIQCVHVSYRDTEKHTTMQSHSRFTGREIEQSKMTRATHFEPPKFRVGSNNIEMHFDNGMTIHIDLPYTVNNSGICDDPVPAGYVEFRDEDYKGIEIPVYIW